MPNKSRREKDMVILRLADCDPHDRASYYESLAELYGDEPLFKIACSLRRRGMIGWGSNWTRCWLTEQGDRAIQLSVRAA